jgi:hypothetical protein
LTLVVAATWLVALNLYCLYNAWHAEHPDDWKPLGAFVVFFPRLRQETLLMNIQHILAPTDFSELSKQGLTSALELAEAFALSSCCCMSSNHHRIL